MVGCQTTCPDEFFREMPLRKMPEAGKTALPLHWLFCEEQQSTAAASSVDAVRISSGSQGFQLCQPWCTSSGNHQNYQNYPHVIILCRQSYTHQTQKESLAYVHPAFPAARRREANGASSCQSSCPRGAGLYKPSSLVDETLQSPRFAGLLLRNSN